MKKQMLLASWISFALIFSDAHAQNSCKNDQFRDTIILTSDANTKVILVGGTLNDLVKYSRLDSLKQLLIEDVTIAEKQAGYPSAPKTTHYFVSSTGKRRLKTEGEDFLEPEVNVEKERQSLDLNLPKYVYIIHDLATNYECYIYVNDPAQLKTLSNESFNDALSSFAAKKKFRRNRYRIDLEKKNDLWNLENTYRSRQDAIEITPALGISLLGSQWSPTLGFDLQLVLSNRYGRPAFKAGFNLSTYALGVFNNDFSSPTYMYSASFKMLRNISRRLSTSQDKWAGLQFGWVATSSGYTGSGYKVGLVAEGFGPFNFYFDLNLLRKWDLDLYSSRGFPTQSYIEPFYSVTLTFPF